MRQAPGLRALALAALLSGCALNSALPVAEHSGIEGCLELFAAADRAVRDAGVRDAGAALIPGVPFLRSNRFLASFAATLEPAQQAPWLAQLRELDRQARRVELANLHRPEWGLAQRAQLENCGDRLAATLAGDARRMRRLRSLVRVPDDYSLWARILGLYPLAVPFLHQGIAGFQQTVREDFAANLNALGSDGELRLWALEDRAELSFSAAAAWVAEAPRDALGMPQIGAAQRAQLLRVYAPAFLIETRGDYDQPGQPLPPGQQPGERRQAGFDASQAPLHMAWTWTRFRGEVLPQLVYTVWFSQRPASGLLDPYAGRLDGLIWRVTLDAQGFPLLYDTVHACGCYHYVFPAQQLPVPSRAGFWQETPLLPQGQTPWWQVAVYLRSADHQVARVLPRALAEQRSAGPAQALQAAEYAQLRAWPSAATGRTRSLFGEDGLVAGTERLERFWLWPSGVRSPGAMRQWGRHATAFVGRTHFDDPGLLERWFGDGQQ